MEPTKDHEPETNVDGVAMSLEGGLAHVRLCRPPVNAVDEAMLTRLGRYVEGLGGASPEVRAVVLWAEGAHFSAGFDIGEDGVALPPEGLARAARQLATVAACPVPMVAVVQGAAVGTGMLLAGCADLLVMTSDARLRLPEVELGMLGGAGHAARWLPLPVVRRMVLFGEEVDAATCASLGAAIVVDDHQAALTTARAWARLVAACEPAVVQRARQVLDSLAPDVTAIHLEEMAASAELRRETTD